MQDLWYVWTKSSIILHITIINDASFQELQGLNEILCFRCKRNTWYAHFKHTLQSPKYLIISVNRLSYIDNQFIKDLCLVDLGGNIRPR